MARTSIKVEKLPVPSTVEAAIPLLKRYAEIGREVKLAKIAADEAKGKIDAARDALLAPFALEAKRLMAALKPFWLVLGSTISLPKRKSAELGGCVLGMRTGNKALGYPKGTEEQLIEDLKLLGFDWAVRVKPELDKEAILKALQPADPENKLDAADAAALAGLGFAVVQAETFFVEPLETESGVTAGLGREAA